MTTTNANTEDRTKTTVGALLGGREIPSTVRDYLVRFIDGEPLPYSDRVPAEYYHRAELVVAVLADAICSNDPLPEGAREFVTEYLYRLEEATGIHIWNHPDTARVALPAMLCLYDEAPPFGDDYGDCAIKAALRHLCTRRELAEFYERHGLKDSYEGREYLAGSAMIDEGNYEAAAGKLSRWLADARTPEATRRELGAALVELASVRGVRVDHPALAGRAMVLACEGVCEGDPEGKTPAHALALRLIDLIDALPPMPEEEGGAK